MSEQTSAWPLKPIGEVAKVNPRPSKDELKDSTLASFIPMRCVEEESGRFEPLEDRKVAEVKKGFTSCRDGDVLFAKVTPCMENGKAAYMRGLTNGIGFASTELFTLRPSDELDAKYLLHFLLQSTFRQEAARNMTGAVGLRRVPRSYLEEQLIPFPPKQEQENAVAEIEKQFTRLETGVVALKRVQANLKRYRAAVLKAACEGRLVETEAELRGEGNYETGEELLERILKERRRKWKGRGTYKEPNQPNSLDLPQIPNGWTWIELDHIAWSVTDGPHYSPKYSEQGIPFISGGNVRPSGVDFANAKRITPELHAELCKKSKPEKGNILYTKGGTTGIARVNTYSEEFSVWVHVAVIKLVDSVLPFHVQHALNSPFCYSQSQRLTHGVGNQDLGLTRMIHISIPLPPLAEQQRIVAEVDRQQSVIDELESVVHTQIQRAGRLRQSVLGKAFRGELVPSSMEGNL